MKSLQRTYKKHHFERNLQHDNFLIPRDISILFALEIWRKYRDGNTLTYIKPPFFLLPNVLAVNDKSIPHFILPASTEFVRFN